MKTNSSDDLKKLESKRFDGSFLEVLETGCCLEFERQQNLGSAYTMSRVVRETVCG